MAAISSRPKARPRSSSLPFISTSSPLLDKITKVATAKLPDGTRITVDPLDKKTKITVEEVAPSVALALNGGGGFLYRVDKKDDAKHKAAMAEIAEVYENITAIVKPGEKISIHIDKGSYSFGPKDARTTVYFDTLKNPDLDLKLQELKTLFDKVHPIGESRESPKYTPGLKGNSSGIPSFDRSSSASLQRNSNDFTKFSNKFLPGLLESTPDKTERVSKLKHMAIAETVADELVKEMKTIREDLKKAHEDAKTLDANSPVTKEAEKALAEQNGIVQIFENLDVFAVFSALAFLPKDENNAIERENCVKAAGKQVLWAIQKQREPIQLKIWNWGSSIEMTKPVKDYAQDIAGLLIDDRGEYYDHCFKADMHMKKDSLEHRILMKVAKGFMSGKPEADLTEALKECFGDDFKTKYTANLEDCMKRILTSAKALQAQPVNLSANEKQHALEFQAQCYDRIRPKKK